MVSTRFTQLVGCPVPVQQAPMGGVASPALAAAVVAAGGLATVNQFIFPGPAEAAGAVGALAKDGDGKVAVNVLMPMVDRPGLEAVAPVARVIDFFWGEPDAALVDVAHAGGALASWQCGSVEQARAAVDAGCDFVIAQGTEAGGHVWGDIALLPLLCATLDAVDVPVLAAGGIGTARALAAVLAAGADGARIGTRFVAAEESGAHDAYKAALVAAGPEGSVLTDRFHVDCPLCPSRHGVLRASLAAAEAFHGDVVGEAALGGRSVPMKRFAGMPATGNVTGTVEAMCMYAGQSVGGVTEIKPAAAIIAELVDGAEALLRAPR